MNPAVHIHLDETGQFGGEDERCAIGGFHTRRAPTDADVVSL